LLTVGDVLMDIDTSRLAWVQSPFYANEYQQLLALKDESTKVNALLETYNDYERPHIADLPAFWKGDPTSSSLFLGRHEVRLSSQETDAYMRTNRQTLESEEMTYLL